MSESDDELSQRRYRRVAVQVGVRISTIDPETDPQTGRPYFRTSEETCGNVSAGGAYVETEEAVSPGRRLLLELDLPDGERLQTVGRVAWTRAALASSSSATPRPRVTRTGMGIEFLCSSSEERQQLEEFLDRNQPRSVENEPAEKTERSDAGDPAATGSPVESA